MSPARVVESCIWVMSYVICDDYIQKYLYNSTVKSMLYVIVKPCRGGWGGKDDITYQERRGVGGKGDVICVI
jgi:hypothetical protein